MVNFENRRDAILKLSQALAVNAVNNSLDITSPDRDKIHDILNDRLIVINGEHKMRRIVLVVGAGASLNACKEIPKGDKGAKILKEKLTQNNPELIEIVNSEIKRLNKIYRLGEEDFETQLLALSKFWPIKLVEEIKKLYNQRFHTSLTYEIIAHLFKHRFIDVIINFNFDELLDQAIEDEFLKNEYYKIISDGDFKTNDLESLFNKGLKLPVYLKPHGTVSHATSLRYTGEHYYGLPSDITLILKNLLDGYAGNGYKNLPIDYIVVGFNMQSFEFNYIIDEIHKSRIIDKSKIKDFIYIINKNNLKENQTVKNFEGNYEFIEIDEKNSLDNTMEVLWDTTSNQFKDQFLPRNIKRHLLISKLFDDKENIKKPSDIKDYIKNRTFIELLLSSAKHKGFLTRHQLSNDRFGKYYSLYKNENSKAERIEESCEEIELKKIGYSNEVFSFNDNNEKLTFTTNIYQHQDYLSVLKKFLNEQKYFSKKFIKKINREEIYNEIIETLKTLTDSRDIEVSPKYENLYDHIFKEPSTIKTMLALDYYTISLFKKEWDVVLTVAETGEWIFKQDELLFEKLLVYLIVADSTYDLELKKKLGIKCSSKKLNWWSHNQHMTIFLNLDENGEIIKMEAIYFTRRYRDIHIHPVILTNWDDCNLLLDIFCSYLLKSKKSNKINKSEVVNERKELLKDIFNKLKLIT